MRARLAWATLAFALAACASGGQGPRDTGLEGLRLDGVDPGVVLPGTTLVLRGSSFVDTDLGMSRLVFDGFLAQAPVRFSLTAKYVSQERMEVAVDPAFIDAVGGVLEGTLDGEFTLDVRSTVDLELHRSPGYKATLQLRAQSTPSVSLVTDGQTWVNQPIQVAGDGFLLGGKEGQTMARLTGCFTPSGQTMCGAPIDVSMPVSPLSEFDRKNGVFAYGTAISGVGPGSFVGQLTVVNQHASGVALASSMSNVSFAIQKVRITGASTTAASLGQYVVIEGNGFVGGNDNESTVLSLKGSFTDLAGGETVPLDVILIPEFVSGPRLRYVLDEGDPLGQAIDLRTRTGTITGTISATVQKGATKLTGDTIPVGLQVLPVKQVIYIEFLNSYYSSLRLFGLRAADAKIRARVLALSQRVFESLNVEFRDQLPTDFALYSVVDIAGPDPNGAGYYGYDNTPGKDVDNLRLYDRIGGVNVLTQQDGYAGFGGVFTESFFSFSDHPNGLAKSATVEPLFDEIFDPFRPDVGGRELTESELENRHPPDLEDGIPCPAPSSDRSLQISCAVWTLGNLIASTMVHEVGHSLGLADPYGDPRNYHNQGDVPNRLMENGDSRPFTERALLNGDGPAEFCKSEYEYLRKTLPDGKGPNNVARESCD